MRDAASASETASHGGDRCDLLCVDAPRAEEISRALPGVGRTEKAAERARSLSDTTRLTLAAALLECEEMCVCDLAWISGRPQNLVSHHLRVLRSIKLARSLRDGKLIIYSLTDGTEGVGPRGKGVRGAKAPRLRERPLPKARPHRPGPVNLPKTLHHPFSPFATLDQLLGRFVGHAGGAADHADSGLGAHDPGVERGRVTAFRGIGAYHASKWALEGLSQSLSRDISGFGIHVTLVEPGPYGTDWLGVGATRSDENPAYVGVRKAIGRSREGGNVGDPKATRDAILKVVDAQEPPLRVFFSETPLKDVTRDYESRLATWNEWQPVSHRGGP